MVNGPMPRGRRPSVTSSTRMPSTVVGLANAAPALFMSCIVAQSSVRSYWPRTVPPARQTSAPPSSEIG